MTVPHEQEEVARNEILFREVNERIVEVADAERPEDDVIVLCECGQPDCLLQLDVPVLTYREVRDHEARFLVHPEHVEREIEHVVLGEPGYLIVEKTGAAGELAEELDPDS
jgi:hypothetical protein